MRQFKRRARQWRRDREAVLAALSRRARRSRGYHVRQELMSEAVAAVWMLRSVDVAAAADPVQLQVRAGAAAMERWLRGRRREFVLVSMEEDGVGEEVARGVEAWKVRGWAA